MPVPYKRVILKLSGEALGENGKGFCHEKFEDAAKMLIDIQHTGVQLAVVIGGGNVWRGRRGAAMRMGTVAADQMGMLGTLQNCLYMRDTLALLLHRHHRGAPWHRAGARCPADGQEH